MEYILTLQQHVRNRSNMFVVRDAKTLATTHQFPITSLQRPLSLQVLDNQHLAVGFSTTRPFHYEFIDETGKVYNKLELDVDKCWILENGLIVEVVGKQTIVKQVMPEFKQPSIVQIYDFAFNWVGQLSDNVLVAQKCDHMSTLCVLELSSSISKWEIPIFVTNLVLVKCMLYGTTLCGDYVFKMCLANVATQGIIRTECVPIVIPRRKSNNIRLTYVNDQFMLYENDQKQHSVIHLVDWTKHCSIWNAQHIMVMTTSQKGWFVYWNRETNFYHRLVCGCSVSKPLPMLTGPPSKSLFQITSDDMLLFYTDKLLHQVNVETLEKGIAQEITRNVLFMATSLCTYTTKLATVQEDRSEQLTSILITVEPPVEPSASLSVEPLVLPSVEPSISLPTSPTVEPPVEPSVSISVQPSASPTASLPTSLTVETPTSLTVETNVIIPVDKATQTVTPAVTPVGQVEVVPASTTCSIM